MIGGERQLRDRNPISLGPAPADARRNAARVQADVDLVNTNIDLGNIGGGGGLTEADVNALIYSYAPVTGGTGNIIGVPVGSPYVYISPQLAAFPMDVSSALLDLDKSGGCMGEIDTQNATAMGADTICLVGSGTGASSKLIGFNPSAGTASSISLPEKPTHFVRFGIRLALSVRGSTTQRVYWVDGGVVSSVNISGVTGFRMVGAGPAANGTDFLTVWCDWLGTGSVGVTVRTYNAAGATIGTQSVTLPTRQASGTVTWALVDNGYIVLYFQDINGDWRIARKDANTSGAWSDLGVFSVDSRGKMGNVSSSGHAFAVSGTDLLRVNVATTSVSVYPGAFVNNESTFLGVYSISSTKAIVAGLTTGNQPFIDTIVLSGGSANVTQTTFPNVAPTAAAFQPVALPSGDVAFGLLGEDGTGPYELLLAVNGP